ncbi:MAG: transcriptional repressor [Planctomycetes bacterium]|nr:transcriptional repressor [Planctomycetota bacterium]
MARSSIRSAPSGGAGALLEKLERYLQRKSQKLTSQRRSLVQKIVEMAKTHFTADDLVAEFFDARPRVSKATIYRSLSVMVEAGILEEHQFGNSYKVYELSEGRPHHDHLICTHCGKILEFFNAEMEELQEKVAKKHGFHATHHSQKIFGVCQQCWALGVRA